MGIVFPSWDWEPMGTLERWGETYGNWVSRIEYRVRKKGIWNSFFLSVHCQKTPKGTALECVKLAIDVGYRHFDGALVYFNEHEVGQAIREKIADGTVRREDIFYCGKVSQVFFTTSNFVSVLFFGSYDWAVSQKLVFVLWLTWLIRVIPHTMSIFVPQLWNTFHPPELVRPALERTLKTLKLDYVDLYIIELPMAFKVCSTRNVDDSDLISLHEVRAHCPQM